MSKKKMSPDLWHQFLLSHSLSSLLTNQFKEWEVPKLKQKKQQYFSASHPTQHTFKSGQHNRKKKEPGWHIQIQYSLIKATNRSTIARMNEQINGLSHVQITTIITTHTAQQLIGSHKVYFPGSPTSETPTLKKLLQMCIFNRMNTIKIK